MLIRPAEICRALLYFPSSFLLVQRGCPLLMILFPMEVMFRGFFFDSGRFNVWLLKTFAEVKKLVLLN
jgi:hypothetical protein